MRKPAYVLSALGMALLCGCATTETIDLGPNVTTFSKEELMKAPRITLPPGYNTDNFRKIRMNVFFESVTGRERVVDSDGKLVERELAASQNLGARLQGAMAELNRFTVRSDYNRGGALAESIRKGVEGVKQDADISLSCKVTATKEKEKRYNDTLVIYEVDVDYSCEDLKTGDVAFAGHAKGRTARSQFVGITGRVTGGFQDTPDNERQAIEQAALKAVVEIANRLGNEYPVGGRITGATATGEKLTLDKGELDGIGANQMCVVFVNDGGVDIPLALADAFPKKTGTSQLEVCRWNDRDGDAKPLVKAFKKDPKGFLNESRVYAVGYGMPVPPAWKQGVDDDKYRVAK
ncbi:MAG: hypothetical protein IJQ73_06710 [Kiritimatiellae bacterium]|nr:hypothetical protein [Kiritimatiellia bacterium]